VASGLQLRSQPAALRVAALRHAAAPLLHAPAGRRDLADRPEGCTVRVLWVDDIDVLLGIDQAEVEEGEAGAAAEISRELSTLAGGTGPPPATHIRHSFPSALPACCSRLASAILTCRGPQLRQRSALSAV
jgi:hypothetical protein